MNVFALLVASVISTISVPTPQQYQYAPDAPVVVKFHQNFWEMPEACNLPAEAIVYGCYMPDTQEIHVLNPCYFPEAKNVDSFAYLMCHENGHVNGWRH